MFLIIPGIGLTAKNNLLLILVIKGACFVMFETGCIELRVITMDKLGAKLMKINIK